MGARKPHTVVVCKRASASLFEVIGFKELGGVTGAKQPEWAALTHSHDLPLIEHLEALKLKAIFYGNMVLSRSEDRPTGLAFVAWGGAFTKVWTTGNGNWLAVVFNPLTGEIDQGAVEEAKSYAHMLSQAQGEIKAVPRLPLEGQNAGNG